MAEPTQTVHPWRATARTAVQVIVGAVLGLGVVLPVAWHIVQEELAKQGLSLPDGAVVVVGAVVAVVVAVSATLARIMAIPQVNKLLQRLGLSAEPKP